MGLCKFFKILFDYANLIAILKLSFSITDQHNLSLTEFENLMIWERDIYITLLNSKIQKENDRIQEEKLTHAHRI